jgi:hypothetical protein
MMRAAVCVLLGLLLCIGCSKEEQKSPDQGGDTPRQIPMIPEAEVARGVDACKRYVERVCACAESKEELKPECELSQSRSPALELSVRTARASGDLDDSDRGAAISNALKIIKACIEADARLDPALCPRSGAATP